MASALTRTYQFYHKCRVRVKKIGVKSLVTEASNAPGQPPSVKIKLGNGKTLTLSTGKLAKLADGCGVVTYRGTSVMATSVSKASANASGSFVPLTVSYKQKAGALGRIPVNFLRRELGQTEHEVLVSRMIDRSIRPLFPQKFNWETQVICNPLAIDGKNFPDVLGLNAASVALSVSDIPWEGPVGAVRVGLVDGRVLINPSKEELAKSAVNLVVASRSSKTIVMIEGSAANVVQSDLFRCLQVAALECDKIIDGITQLRASAGKNKRTFAVAEASPELRAAVEERAEEIKILFQNLSLSKLERDTALFKIRDDAMEKLKKEFGGEDLASVPDVFHDLCKKIVRDLIFETGVRCDGRNLKELRPIMCEVNLYEPLHGSALFQRGQTQVLCTVALDSPASALRMDKVSMLTSGVREKNFFVHYEFPPFANNETGRLGPTGRREIGHGALAEKALQANIPDDFPFTIRLTSEVLESNGSSSMATVCGGTLALLDAGVPLASPCAGVAMGFLSKTNEGGEITEYRILTDLMGLEDHYGEIDFKVAATNKAFTALQLDVKNRGLPLTVVCEILETAKEAAAEILKIMRVACPQARKKKKSSWPEKSTFKVPVHLRRNFFGPGGLHLKKLEMTTGVEVTEDAIGEFSLFAPNSEALKEANEIIENLLKDTEEMVLDFGGVYTALITEIRDTGCMVTLYPNMKPVHIHLSQLDVRQVSHPKALGLEVGQEIQVKYFGRDPSSGTMRLSRKVLLGPASEVARQLHRQEAPAAKRGGSEESEEVRNLKKRS